MKDACPDCGGASGDDYFEFCARCGYVPPHGAD
jgi:hypothetical protein